MGSGTTAIAAAQNGRDFIGIEISHEYCQMAEERLLGAKGGLFYV
jgi:DNA modification methylase